MAPMMHSSFLSNDNDDVLSPPMPTNTAGMTRQASSTSVVDVVDAGFSIVDRRLAYDNVPTSAPPADAPNTTTNTTINNNTNEEEPPKDGDDGISVLSSPNLSLQPDDLSGSVVLDGLPDVSSTSVKSEDIVPPPKRSAVLHKDTTPKFVAPTTTTTTTTSTATTNNPVVAAALPAAPYQKPPTPPTMASEQPPQKRKREEAPIIVETVNEEEEDDDVVVPPVQQARNSIKAPAIVKKPVSRQQEQRQQVASSSNISSQHPRGNQSPSLGHSSNATNRGTVVAPPVPPQPQQQQQRRAPRPAAPPLPKFLSLKNTVALASVGLLAFLVIGLSIFTMKPSINTNKHSTTTNVPAHFLPTPPIPTTITVSPVIGNTKPAVPETTTPTETTEAGTEKEEEEDFIDLDNEVIVVGPTTENSESASETAQSDNYTTTRTNDGNQDSSSNMPLSGEGTKGPTFKEGSKSSEKPLNPGGRCYPTDSGGSVYVCDDYVVDDFDLIQPPIPKGPLVHAWNKISNIWSGIIRCIQTGFVWLLYCMMASSSVAAAFKCWRMMSANKPVGMNNGRITSVMELCAFLSESGQILQRNGRCTRAASSSPNRGSPSCGGTPPYQRLTKDDLILIATKLGLTWNMASGNKATLLDDVVYRYQQILNGFTKNELKQVLNAKGQYATNGLNKHDMIQLALETGF